MKIQILIRDWSALKVKSENFRKYEYGQDEIDKKEVINVDYDEYEEVVEKRGLFGKIKSRDIVIKKEVHFSFKLLKQKENSVILELGGDAGCHYKRNIYRSRKSRMIPQVIELEVGQSKTFTTHTKDSGSDYTITLLS